MGCPLICYSKEEREALFKKERQLASEATRDCDNRDVPVTYQRILKTLPDEILEFICSRDKDDVGWYVIEYIESAHQEIKRREIDKAIEEMLCEIQ
jgi:hypothetical protein